MSRKHLSIRQRIVLYFALLSLVVSLIFTSFNAFFMWVVEDAAFRQILLDEKNSVQQTFESTGNYGSPKHRLVRLIQNEGELPLEVRQGLQKDREADEFSGRDGENFHVIRIQSSPNVYLLGEFSDLLIVNPALNKVLSLLFIATVILFIASCFIGYYLANLAISPLSDLMRLIKNSPPGKLPNRFSSAFSDDEVGFLAQTIEEAMNEVGEFIEREQNFTRDVSHELRTSIAVIKGVGEVLDDTKTQSQSDVVDRLQSASLHMEQIVETLLSLVREGKNLQQKTTFKVLPMIEDVVVAHARVIEEKPIEVEIHIKESDMLHAHQVVAEILFSNLISNSFQHVQQGVISISYKDSVFCVSDNGAGIESELREDILKSGVKGSASEGYGIGLSLVQRLCEKQDINLDIKSDQSGTSVALDFSAAHVASV